ncbi:hypothetical protein [Neobacillus mesonae]|uniref:hypothetical protein n=1 Tax=Neobacillus mesonae TaxID=1193713 RepID=UPI0025727CB2|nr:hypothetical protein [Neobacillus mesonae]
MNNLKSGSIENFKEYSQFTSLAEFNRHMEMWLSGHKDTFTKGEIIGFKRLVRFAAKFPGVCNAKIGTMVAAIHKEYNGNGISRSTFKRMIHKAKELGIFTAYETEKQNGWQSSNVYVFNRFPNEPPKQMSQPKETSNPLKTEKDQKINKRKEEPSAAEIKLDHTYVSSRVPKPFVELVRVIFSEAKTIQEYWHMTKIAAHRGDCANEPKQILAIAIDSFKQLIRKMKSTHRVKNPIAYFFGILSKKFNQLHNEEPWNENLVPDTNCDEELLDDNGLYNYDTDPFFNRLERDGCLERKKESSLQTFKDIMEGSYQTVLSPNL